MKIKLGDTGISEIIGAAILLAMAVSVFSVIYINVLSDNGPAPDVFVTINGKMETGEYGFKTLVFDNQHGETLDPETKILLTINGTAYPDGNGTTINDLVSRYPEQHYLVEDGWNVGEKLYPINPKLILNNVPIYANIIDKESNSIVFWGTLQEGSNTKMGGIWHFNETWWNGTTGEVKDSSGNGNNGTAYNDANTSEIVVNAAINAANRSGYFNYPDGTNDFVDVPNAFSLNIQNQITIEAWIKPESIGPGGNTNLEEKFGYTPYIIKSSSSKNIYIVVSEEQGHAGMIQTVNITPYKQLEEGDILDFEYYGHVTGDPGSLRPVISQISENVYVVAYNNQTGGNTFNVYLQRFNINSEGDDINYVGNNIFDINNSNIGSQVTNRPSIIKVSKDIFAVAYNIIDRYNSRHGIIKTIKIFSNGNWDYTGYYNYFETGRYGYEPSIINVSGDVFAVAYRDSLNYGIIKTFKINSTDGKIDYTNYRAEFENIQGCFQPSIIHVVDNVFAITYRINSDHGFIKTIEIYTDGTINGVGIDSNSIESNCYNPCIICLSEKHYVITFSTSEVGSPPGDFITLEIVNNGLIFNIEQPKIFESQDCMAPTSIKIADRVFAIVYESHGAHPGKIQIVEVSYSSDVNSTGVICKDGSYGIYANSTKLVAHICNETKTVKIEIPIDSSDWHHVILTYDGTEMVLYIDGGRDGQVYSTPLEGAINISESNLTFGNLYYGYIDEIAIFDKVISAEDRTAHSDRYIGIWRDY